MPEEIIINMGRYAVSDTEVVLVSLSLGSCVGVTLYDREKKVGAMAHVMLPRLWNTDRVKEDYNIYKFADVVIPKMIEEMQKKGCSLQRITAKIAGGAHMFPGISEAEVMDIGKQNTATVSEELEKLGIKITGSEIGGHVGRTVRFNTNTGEVTVKTKDYVRVI
jgi:chemotaxis protein CheD